MSLVGRDAELKLLEDVARAGAAGASGLVTITGEAGIGKSELLAAGRRALERAGLRTVHARAAEHERDVPFGLLVEAFDGAVAALPERRVAALGPDLAVVVPAAAAAATMAGEGGSPRAAEAGPAERFRLHRAFGGLLEELARERPLAVVLDDVHWADPASVELLLHLLHRPPRGPVVLLVALRPAPVSTRLLAAAALTGTHRHLTLGPLAPADAAALVASEIPDAAERAALVDEAGGHPLFLRELARAAGRGTRQLPPTIVAAITLELARLDGPVRALAGAAAVAGDPFDPELAAAAADITPDAAVSALDALVAADLVRATGDGRLFAFRHPLVHRAVYDGTPPAWRLGAHERVAARLAERGDGVVAQAYHVARAARPGDRAAIALLEEAALATRGRAPDAAVRWLQAALRLLPAADLARRAELLAQLAGAQADAGRLADCRATLLEGLALTPGDVRLLASCATIEQFLGVGSQARGRLAAALERAAPGDRPLLHLELAVAAYFAFDPDGLLQHALAALDATGAPGAAAHGLAGLGHRWHRDAEAAERALDEGLRRFVALEDDALADYSAAAVYLGLGLLLGERTHDALATLTRGVDVCRRSRRGGLLPVLLFLRGMIRAPLLQLDGAVEDLEAAEESARLQGLANTEQWAVGALALTHWQRGEPGEVARVAATYERLLEGSETTIVTATHRCNIAATRAESDPERCVREMVAAGGEELERTDPVWSVWQLRVLVRAAITAGRVDDADRWAAIATARARERGLPTGRARAAAARAEVLLARGDIAAARATAEEAVRLAEATRTPADVLEARELHARALAAAGERDTAIALLREDVAAATAAGALRLRDAAARDLRALGVRVTGTGRPPARGAGPLSPREQEIAALVAQGHPNREVAAALFVSEKTVEYHLSHVFQKLGIRSRVELAGRLGPLP